MGVEMKLTPVESSHIAAIGYLETERVLLVRYKDGSLYAKVIDCGLAKALRGGAPAAMGGGLLPAANLLGGTIKNEGSGTADQTATLTGSVAVSVIDVMANGNLVLRGEKQLALTEGAEIIQVAGVVRPDDIAPNNTVQSRRLANAQITYRGTGDMAAASRAGWATSGLLKLWPF